MSNFWSNKKVLITGDSGFKGSWLTCLLLKLGCKITGISLKPDKSNKLYNELKKDKNFFNSKYIRNYKHLDLDIRNYEKLYNLITEFEPDIIFHLAAQPLVRESYKNPILTWDTNVMGTINLLNSIKNLKSCSVVVITTDKVYENRNETSSYKESDELGGTDTYSSSKSAGELAVKSWRKSFYQGNIKISTARAGNVIGGGDWAYERIVPDTINALINNKKLRLRYPNAIRPWQHVLDPLSGYLILAEKQIQNQKSYAYNFGPNDNERLTVIELVNKISFEWGEKIKIVNDENQPPETNHLTLSTQKAKVELNWHPKWDVNKSISQTINWYKKVHNNASPFDTIIDDIDNFLTGSK